MRFFLLRHLEFVRLSIIRAISPSSSCVEECSLIVVPFSGCVGLWRCWAVLVHVRQSCLIRPVSRTGWLSSVAFPPAAHISLQLGFSRRGDALIGSCGYLSFLITCSCGAVTRQELSALCSR